MTDTSNHTRLPSLGRLRRYLRSYGWSEQHIPDRHADLYTREFLEFGDIEIVLPSSDRPGLATALTQAIRTLASVESVSFDQMSQRVWSIAFDLIETIIPTHSMFLDSISLHLAEQAMRSTRRIIGRNAQAELNSTSGVYADASSFIDSCKFAHTFSGSFGFRIEAPIGPNPDNDQSKQPIPFERRVTQRLARGIKSISQAVVERNPTAIVDNAENGFDSSTCAAFVSFLEETRISEFKIQCLFSRSWEIPPDIDQVVSANIGSDLLPIMKEAAASLKDKSPFEYSLIRGRVVGLTSRYNPDDVSHPDGREITLSYTNKEGKEQRVHVNLSPEHYMFALQAHVQGRDFMVAGYIRKVGRQLRMENLLPLPILPGAPGRLITDR